MYFLFRLTPHRKLYLRDQPRTPPSGYNLGVLNYHLKHLLTQETSRKYDQDLLCDVSLSFLSRKRIQSILDTTYWLICLHYCYMDNMVVRPGYNIPNDFSHSAEQKLLCSRTNCLCSRIWKRRHPCVYGSSPVM